MIPNITAGETISYTQSFTGYDPSTDTLVFDCVTGSLQVVITATDNGNGSFLIAATNTATNAWVAGIYSYQARIETGAGATAYVEAGSFEVKPNFAAMTSGYDNRSLAKKCLDAIEVVLLGKASQDQLSYSISGRSLSRFSHAELLNTRDKYKAEYVREIAAERISQGLGNPNTIRFRM